MKPHLLIAQVDCDSEIALASHYKSPITSDLQNVYYKTLYVFKDIFRRHAIQGTFFVVGKDLESETKCETLNSLVLEGHEIANHTYTHPSNPVSYTHLDVYKRQIIYRTSIRRKWLRI